MISGSVVERDLVPTYLVSFQSSPDRALNLLAAIKSEGDWAILTPSCVALTTETPLAALIERLHVLADDPADQLWIVGASGPWAGWGDPIVPDHLCVLGPEVDWTPRHPLP